MPYNSKIIGQTIYELRKKRRISQEILSGFAGIARSHLSMIENGRKNISVETLWRIAGAFDMRLSELVRLAEEKADHLNGEKIS